MKRCWMLLSILPLAAYVLLLLAFVSHIQREMLHDQLKSQMEEASERVQRLIDQEFAYLSGIAVSQALDSADLDGFRTAAELAWKERSSVYTIILNDRDQQLLNLRLGQGRKPSTWETESLTRVWETGRPTVGDLANGMFAIRVPVLRGGNVRYVLSEVLSPWILNDLLREIAAKGWLAALVDRRMTIVARSENADRYVGSSPTPDIVQNIRAGRTGLETVVTKDGIPAYSLTMPLEDTGWHLVIGIPQSTADASYRSMRWLLLGGGGVLVLLIAFGLWVGWRNVRSMESATENLSADLADAHRESDEKSALLAMVSHELRTPLTGIIGLSELLTNSYLDDQQKELVTRQTSAGRMLMGIVNDILDYSKIQANGIQLESVDFDVLAILEQSMALARPMADAKGLALAIGQTSGAVRWLRGDPTRLQQVINNFLSNAVKFTTHGEVRLSMGQERDGEGRILLKVAVRDTGIGIAHDQQERLFNRFAQANPAIAREYGGTGLGLSISKLLAERMGGRVGFESVAGQGSTFWLAIPFDEAKEPARSPVAATAPASEEEGPKERILLVEDDGVGRFLTQTILQRSGYTVVAALDGREAIETIQRHDFDLVLMDTHMPVMNGIEATRAIRALGGAYARVPIWALTGSTFQSDIEDCLSAGMDGHLAKPFLPKELLSTVRHGLEKRHAPESAAKPSLIDRGMQDAMVSSIGQEKVDELQSLFLDWLKSVRAAFPAADTDPDALFEESHRLIGSAGMFGYARIVEAARALCHACQSGDAALVAREHVRLLAEMDAVRETRDVMPAS
ncbi:Signal transduction histidine kinase [Azospirillum lipoferum]|nr:Signal transduction histidine kinase [Azospirillum lipoferum]